MEQDFFHWDKNKLNRPYYFFFYYIPKRLTDNYVFSDESIKVQHYVWNFKDGINQEIFIKLIIKKIKDSFKTTNNLSFICIPASTVISNIYRYKHFSDEVCKALGMSNSFDHVKIITEKEPKHISGIETFSELQFDLEYFKDRSFVVFDDVVTKGNSMRRFIAQLESLGANVVACISIAQTYKWPIRGELSHPWSGNFVRSTKQTFGESLINAINNIEILPSSKNKTSIQYKFGDIITFGSFYDKPIEWEVLEQKGDNILLISKYGLTCRSYNKVAGNVVWSNSSLRKWLNNTFYERSFSLKEKERMIKHLVNAEVVSGHELNPGENTHDYVHILSVDEYCKFYGKNHHWKCFLVSNKKVLKQCWLRTYGKDSAHAAFVGRSGRLHEGGSLVESSRNTVRPVILIKSM